MKKVLILGGVAAGTKTAAKLKRLRRNEYDVTILTKDKDISYAGCGLPYYVGGAIEELDSLIVNTPEKYTRLTGAQVLTGWEAIAVDPAAKKVRARTENGEEQDFPYDELVITTGASAVLPPIPGMDKKGIFKLRTPEDAAGIRTYIQTTKAAKALVIGAGFIGLETAENLLAQGLSVTVVEAAPQILPHVFDPEMAAYVQRQLQKKGLQILTGVKASSVLGDATATGLQTEMGPLQGDILIASAGIRPNTAFLKDLGLEMTKGTLLVNEHLQTSLPDIYAAGDCAMVTNRLTKAPQWSPMGSSANLEGRTLAHVLIGIPAVYPGVLGTSVIKLPGLNCARTGLTEAAARDAIVGAGLGFLWFNTYPAQVFMGDVGSLALGGVLGVIAVLIRQEFLLVIMGGVFVMETMSVILQVGSYKLRGQRIFRMAPIHHHYELKGWPEPRVIVRFWIITLVLVLLGLVTLKLR